jgi:hypothetical protein
MALSRAELKQVIKELLIEVLSEGLGNVQATAYRSSAPNRSSISGVTESRRQDGRRKPGFDPRLDTPIVKQPSSALKEAIKRQAGGNAIMADILADTAATTLPTMLSHGDTGGAAPEMGHAPKITQQEQFHGAPEEVFGEEVTGRWADLAFATAKKSA